MAKDVETKVEEATPLADETKGEISPAADQSNRGDEMAARMAVTPPRAGRKPKEEKSEPTADKEGKIVHEDGTIEYVDPDDLVANTVVEEFPKDVCVNCRNHGRDEVKLNKNGFCKQCGFKLNRIYNMALEPSRS